MNIHSKRLLRRIPREHRRKFINNWKSTKLTKFRYYETVCTIIALSFDWQKTPEGGIFWDNIFNDCWRRCPFKKEGIKKIYR